VNGNETLRQLCFSTLSRYAKASKRFTVSLGLRIGPKLGSQCWVKSSMMGYPPQRKDKSKSMRHIVSTALVYFFQNVSIEY